MPLNSIKKVKHYAPRQKSTGCGCVCVCVIETLADLLTTNVYDNTCFAAMVPALFYRRLL